MVLIVSHLADEHATAVLAHLQQKGVEALLFDTSRFPGEISLDLTFETKAPAGVNIRSEGVFTDLSRAHAVWWRRPRPYRLDSAITRRSDQEFAHGECDAAIGGLWSCLEAQWMNDPERDEVAARKAYQLKVAARLGFCIPRTLMTNSPERALEFVAREGEKGTIYKAFSATIEEWRETRLLRKEEVAQIASVALAPLIFQEYIQGGSDPRITVIGDEIFAAEILAQESEYPVDYRMTLHKSPFRVHKLPQAIKTLIHRLMNTLGLMYGAIDMRRNATGAYVFLEVNPAGQWLFVEEKTGLPITAAVADWLARADRTYAS